MSLISKAKRQTLGGILGLACVYFVAGKLGLSLSLVADNVTLIWPPTGLALGSLLLFGPKLWPGVLLGALSVSLTTAAPHGTAVAIAMGNTGEALAGYWLLARWMKIDPRLPRVRDALGLIVLGGGVAPMVSATVGVAALIMGGVVPVAAGLETWALWWMGDAMGAIVFGPVLLAWVGGRSGDKRSAGAIETVIFAATAGSIALLTLGGIGPFAGLGLPLGFLAIPIGMWGSMRFGLRGVMLCVLGFTLAALWGVSNGAGLFKRATPVESLSLLWLYANTLAISGVVLSSYFRQLTKAQQELLLAASVFEQVPVGIAITDPRGRSVSVNSAYAKLMGYPKDECIGKDMRHFAAPRHSSEELEAVGQSAAEQGFWTGEIWNQRIDGDIFPTETTVGVARDAAGNVTHFIAAVTDTTARKHIEAHNRELAEHDVLTGLPNRMLLTDRLHRAILFAARQQGKMAVLFIDLDRFKVINDSLGHDLGDEMLQLVAARLQGCVRDEDTVARQGGDEFVIIVNEVHTDADVAHVAQKVLDAVAKPYELRGYALDITASIGIAVYPRDGTDAGALLKHADLAMYHGKEGRATYHFYGEEMDKRAQARLSIEGRLRRALEHGEFLLHYQPQVDAEHGAIVGLEALLRWRGADGELIAPGEFISIAEETGLILPIGNWVLHEAAAQAQRWQAQGLNVPRIAVNVSARQLWHGDFDLELQRALDQTGVDPRLIEVELTESVFLRSTDDVAATLARLDALGVRIAIDDFGTGYSSLSYLRRLPVDTLKLDRSFVQDLPHSRAAGAIASAVISLARGLDIAVVAEGVETEAQYAYLRGQGCHHIQGFYFSKPLPADACVAVLQAGALGAAPS